MLNLFAIISIFILMPQDQFLKEESALDELSVPYPINCSSNGSKVFIFYYKGLKPVWSLYDFETDRVVTIIDPRLKLAKVQAIPYEEGFALLSTGYQPSVYYTTGDGDLLEKVPLESFQGWKPNLTWQHLSPDGEYGALISCADKENKLLLLAKLDFKKRSISWLTQREWKPFMSENWITDGKDLYFVEGRVSAITLLDKETYKTKKKLRGAREPVPKKKQRPRRAKYYPMLAYPMIVDQKIHYNHILYRTDAGDIDYEPKSRTITIDSQKLRTDLPYTLGVYQGKRLVFDYEWQEFRVIEVE